MSKEHPTPWTFHAIDACEDQPILDANGNEVLVRDSGVYPPDLDTCREIVDAVNEKAWDEQVASAVAPFIRPDAAAELNRLRAELACKTRNYEYVIACYQRTEEYLRGLIKRLITVHEKVFWRKDEKTGMTYETCLMDEDEVRKTIEEAKTAVKEDKE